MNSSSSDDEIPNDPRVEEAKNLSSSGGDEPPPQQRPPYLSEGDAVSVMRLLLRRGYFHDNNKKMTNESSKNETTGPSSGDERVEEYDPNEATVIETASGTFCTLKHLHGQLQAILDEQKCCTLSQAATLLGLKDEKQIHRVLAQQQDGNAWILVGDQILTQAHLRLVAQWIQETLLQEQQEHSSSQGTPMISIAQVAREWKWSVDDCARLLMSSITYFSEPLGILQKTRANGTRVYILQQKYKELEEQLQQTLKMATRPVSILTLCQEQDWEHSWIVQDFLHNHGAADSWVPTLPGEWHNGGDTFVPHAYTHQQQETVLDILLHQSGVLLVQDVCAMVDNIRPYQVQSYLQKAMATDPTSSGSSVDDIVFFDESVVNLQIIVPPLEALVQDAIASETWCELDCLPIQLLSSTKTIAVAKRLLIDYVLKKVVNTDIGVVAVTKDGAMFVSRKQVLDLETHHVRPLIPKLAQARAKEVWSKWEEQHETTTMTSVTASSLLTVDILMETVTKACPDLARFAEDNQSLVQEFCACAFGDNNVALSKACQAAVSDEVVRLEKQAAALAKSKTSSSSSTGGDGSGGTLVAHHTTAEVSFEDASCFTAACHLVQAYAKFLDYAATRWTDDTKSLEILRQAFFQGACADFTRRMTQYCLHKYNMDDDVNENDDGETGKDAPTPHFSFTPKDAPKQPSFCSPIDIAMRRYPYKTYLSCSLVQEDEDAEDANNDDDDDDKRDPLAVLRTVLPGNVGQALTRQWTLCGKECYETSSAGGDYDHVADATTDTTPSSNSSAKHKDPAVAAFLNHVEEHCLTICGLPFKKLDKKSEKHLLAARRTCLLQALQRATDPRDVLELTVMILYQSVKNQVVFDGADDKHSLLLCCPILQLLIQERKISEGVGTVLTDLAEQVLRRDETNKDDNGDDAVDVDLVERVRACGLCKDIAKHTVQ